MTHNNNEPGSGQSAPLPPSRFGAGYSVGGTPEGAPPGASSLLRYPDPTYSHPPQVFESDNTLRYPDPPPAMPPPSAPPVVPMSGVGYGTPVTMVPGGYIPVQRHTNGMAHASLISSLVGTAFCGIGWIFGIIFGHIALSQIKRTGDDGRGLAIAGLIVSYTTLALIVVVVVVVAIASAT